MFNIKNRYQEKLDSGLSPIAARRGVKTEVHEELQASAPMPYSMPPAKKLFIVGREPTQEEKASGLPIRTLIDASPIEEADFYREQRLEKHTRLMSLLLTATNEHTRAHLEHNASLPPGHANRTQDPVHHAQREHSLTLWAQTDELINSELGAT